MMKKLILSSILGSFVMFNMVSVTRVNSLETVIIKESNRALLNETAAIALSGAYTIGSGGDFISFTEAINVLNSEGVSGPVVFNVLSGTYTEQVTISAITGSSETNTVTFESASGVAADVVISFNSTGTASNYVIRFDNASDIILRNLSVQALGRSYARTLHGANRAENLLIEGCKLISPITNGSNNDRGNVVLTPSVSGNIRFIANEISGGSTGITYVGNSNSVARALGTIIRGNTLSDVYQGGLDLQYHWGAAIENNKVTLRETAGPSSIVGVNLDKVDGALRFVDNRVIGGLNGSSVVIKYCTATPGAPGLIANNFIMSAASSPSYYMIGNNYQQIFHNSINNSSTGASFYYNGSGSVGNVVKNNIFKANTGAALLINTLNGLDEFDYNDLFNSGAYLASLLHLDIDVENLLDWQTASSKDVNSLSVDPKFTSDTELYAASSRLAAAGTPLSEVVTDIDGIARKATPTIGANEYDAVTLAPLSGIYTINPAGSGNRNFTTLQMAVDVISQNGVSAAVVFQIADGTYNEQVIISDILGRSPTNTVAFESSSGNAESVIISFNSTATVNNYVIRFDNTSDIVLRNLTVQALGVKYARTLHAQNRVENLLVEGCNLISRIASVANNSRGNILLEPSVSRDIQFINNTITGGATGIFYNGTSNSGTRAFGTVLRGNTLRDPHGGFLLKYHSGAIIRNNDIKLLATGYTGSVGALLDEMDGALRFVNNRVIGAKGSGVLMRYCDATSEAPGLVANNFIKTAGDGSGNYSYSMSNNAYQRIFHNNMNNTGTGAPFYYHGLSSAGNVVKNNIFKTNWSYAVHVSDGTGLDEMDYNDFFTSGTNMGNWRNTIAPDLTTWKTLSGKDANSLNEDPLFLSDEDLTPQNENLAEAGFDLTTIVQNDLNGNQRTVPVSMGAIEFGTNDPCAGIICSPGTECYQGGCFSISYSVAGTVRDADTKVPLSNVLVQSDTRSPENIYTDANGFYEIFVFYEEKITYSKSGYGSFTSQPILENASALDVLLSPSVDLCEAVTCLPGFECYQGQCVEIVFSVAGTVRDADTKAPLSDVLVKGDGDSASIYTDANGFYEIFVFYEEKITYSKSGYGSFTSQPILENASALDVLLSPSVDLCEAVTCLPGFECYQGQCVEIVFSVAGTVRDADTKATLSDVLVKGDGDSASIYTDANGLYEIFAFYEEKITYSKSGYASFTSQPILEDASPLDVLLSSVDVCDYITCPPGTQCYQGQCVPLSYSVTGIVRDADTNASLSNVLVEGDGDSASIFTDANGLYEIFVFYKEKITYSKSGYDSFTSQPILEDASALDVLLSPSVGLCEGITCPPGEVCVGGQCFESTEVFFVSGKVSVKSGNPFPDVQVSALSGSTVVSSVFTDANGFYSIGIIAGYQLKFERQYFEDFVSEPISKANSNFDVILYRSCEGVYCALGTACYQGECYRACQYDGDCPEGTKCFEGICLPLQEVVVTGIVRDKDTNLPLANVQLGSLWNYFDTVSDENGYFEAILLERDVVHFLLKDYDEYVYSAIIIDQPHLEIYLQYNPKDPCEGVYCALGTSCVNGECIATCQLDWDCPEGTFCMDGNCLTLEQLCWATICPEGTTCLNGRCISDDDPCVNSNCPEGTYCLNGNCFIVNDPTIIISGVIKDVVTGATLSGVLVDAGYKQVLSETDGSYSIRIPFGFSLNFSRWDYVEFTSSPLSATKSNYSIELYKNWCLIHDCQPGQVCVNGRCETIFYTVSGVVRDEATNLPIANATVKTPGAQSQTDEFGAYTIQVILDNTLLFDKEGYAIYQSSNIQTDNGAFDVLLGPDLCAGVSCLPGFICENGVCVPDPCAATVCQPGEYCFNGDCLPIRDLTIMGTVRDINTGKPIAASAAVNGIATLVDYNGYFIVEVPYGDRILFIANGYLWEYSSYLLKDNAVLEILMTPDADCADIFCPDGKICRDGVCIDPCTDVVCPPGEKCVGGQCFQIICEGSLTALQVSPEIGTSETEFTFTITYTDFANTNLNIGYPKLELDSNDNNSAADPGDLVFAMTEVDPSDLDLTDGKIYQVTVSGLKDNSSWKARVVAHNAFNCSTTTPYINAPNVSVSNLDVAIFANNISFSNDNPNNNEVITIFARVRNISDFPAENFVVSAYYGATQIFTNVIANLAPRSHIDLSWQYSFAEAGFYPIKVVLDETNVLEEINELNNFAIRPVLVGNYVLPGGIQATAIPNTTTAYAGSWITISGYASYFGIDEGINPDVAGANVSFIYENGSFQTTTNSNGAFSRSIQMPTTPGIYTFTGSVTDYTLTGEITSFPIEVIAQPAKADLVASISLDQREVLEGEKITGIATVANLGELTATSFTFRYSSCEGIIGEVPIKSLAPGEALSFDFEVIITKELGSCFAKNNCSFTALADVLHEVDDKTRHNNSDRKSVTVYPVLPDLTPSLSSIASSSRMEEPFLFMVRINNISRGNVGDKFVVNVYVDDQLLDSKNFENLQSCEQIAYQLSVDFKTKEDHVIRIKVDEPLGSGSIEEYLENNNEFMRTVTYIPPPVFLPNLYITNTSLSVEPSLPGESENFLIKAMIKNTGQVPITEAFDVNFQISEDGVLRNETIVVATGLENGAEFLVAYETSLASYGNHSVLVALDPLDKIDEASEYDNKASMPLCLDFAVDQTGAVWNGGFLVNTQQNLTGRVRNLGLFTATNVRVDFFLNGSEIGSAIIPEMKPSYGHSGEYVSIPYTFRETGIFQLEMVIDRNDDFGECNEINNSIMQSIVVKAPQPDLRILSEYISPSSLNPEPNEEINLFVSFENIGSNTLSPFKIRVTVDDIPLGDDILVEELKAGQLSTVPVVTPYSSSTAGVKVVRGFVDIDKDADDANYANNNASRSIVVGEAPNLFFTQIRFSNNCPQVGEQIQISVDIENEGDLASNAEVHFYYVTDKYTVPIDVVPIFVDLKNAITTSINWTVINPEYRIYAEIKNSDPVEFNDLDNTIWGEYKDTTPPTVITRNIIVCLDENGLAEVESAQVDKGSFDDCGIASMSLNVTNFDCSNVGENTVALTVMDANGNSASKTAIVTVEDKISPTIEAIADRNESIGSDCNFSLPDYRSLALATDNCSAVIVTQTPVAGSVFSNHGAIIPIVIVVEDGHGNSNRTMFNVALLGQHTFYADMDGDGFGDNNVPIIDCSPPLGYVTDNTDCDDTNSSIYPGSLILIEGVDYDCDGFMLSTEDLESSKNLFRIYPNPSSSFIYCLVPKHEAYQIKIYNQLGQTLYIYNGDNDKLTIDVSFLESAVYMVNYTAKNGSSQTVKFIKN